MRLFGTLGDPPGAHRAVAHLAEVPDVVAAAVAMPRPRPEHRRPRIGVDVVELGAVAKL